MAGQENWTREEVEAVIADYFVMLGRELRGEPYNKAEHNRNLRKILTRRSAASIEKKHQNISAVLLELGCPYINGYKPLRNFQAMLGSIVEERLSQAEALTATVSSVIEQAVEAAPAIEDILSILVDAPSSGEDEPRLYEKPQFTARHSRRNYLEIEARNRSLGLAGEQFVLRFEHERLWRAGERTLAERIEHVSSTKGDGLGYDVLSFETSGKERLIEVKTTRFGPMTPFFASRNEVAASEAHASAYKLYRLFSFRDKPKLYTLDGSLRSSCILEPVSYTAMPA